MVSYAAAMARSHGGDASFRIARHLVNAQHDRVAEIAAAALLRLVERTEES